jgi:hypothetical protein
LSYAFAFLKPSLVPESTFLILYFGTICVRD